MWSDCMMHCLLSDPQEAEPSSVQLLGDATYMATANLAKRLCKFASH